MKVCIGLFLLGGLLFSGCQEDPVIQMDGFQSKPAIYCIINSRDSIHIIRLERFYSGMSDPSETARIPDSIYFNSSNLKVTLRRPNGAREEIPVEQLMMPEKEPGIFDPDPYVGFWFYKQMVSGYPGRSRYDSIFIQVDIPGLPQARCSTSIVSPPIIWSPVRAQMYIYVYPDNPMRVLWEGGAWNEIDVSFQVMEQYQDSTVTRSFTLQKTNDVHINEQYYEIKTPYELVSQILQQNLKVDNRVIRRYFGAFRIEIHTGNEDFNKCLKFMDGINDFNYNPYFNIVNGIGLLSSRSTTIKTAVYLDQVSRLNFAADPDLLKFKFIEY